MPEPALPIPHDPALTGLVSFRREYRDLLQRPLAGHLTLRATRNYKEGRTVVGGSPVKVPVVEGVLALDIPPGEYVLRGNLWNRDEERMQVEEEFTIKEAQ